MNNQTKFLPSKPNMTFVRGKYYVANLYDKFVMREKYGRRSWNSKQTPQVLLAFFLNLSAASFATGPPCSSLSPPRVLPGTVSPLERPWSTGRRSRPARDILPPSQKRCNSSIWNLSQKRCNSTLNVRPTNGWLFYKINTSVVSGPRGA
jgi:hypothetical protein